MKRLGLVIVLSVLATPLAAQWLNYPTPGIPRTPDGKPNRTAPAPRTPDGKPDLSGLWQRTNNQKYRRNIAADLRPEEIQPWARNLVAERMEHLGKGHMAVHCLPWGPAYLTSERMFKIVQTPGLILMLDPDVTFRQIFMDGRPLEKEPNPTWMGYSVGRWEGDMLVVESYGYNDKTWLDSYGHPHSEALRMTERYRRRDVGHMDIEVTFSDPNVYARPWTVKFNAELEPDTELFDAVCAEGAYRSLESWVGKASDEKKNEAMVAPAILAKYVGTYVEQDLWGEGPHPRIIQITVENGRLAAELSNRGKAILIAQSDTTFAGLFGWGVKFVTDSSGVPTHLLEMHVSGDYRFVKRK
ncbi:MAG: hypothetical protein HYY76_15490 [Acidobacteria bacterium]|nr:hypothetical protein [Acidobacteriota bacterium]